ncbi:metal-dependent hydrolase family protein [Pandoraea anapnoica]|uniref:metal-dependent hydrolase family protein n=1 Tax=Pandoraea anapnoica TaxID=2508301 RepID=UPI001FE7B41F|nr:amidohydrolase family protein [Pandoraea anapnoica]
MRPGCDVLVVDGEIRDVSETALKVPAGTEVIDCAGRVLMPGLIDAHVHVYGAGLDVSKAVKRPGTYLAHYAARFLTGCLNRGFTTVRDVGGGDVGLATALQDGLLEGPRLFYGGRVLSQTGGHGDMRPGDHDLDAAHAMCGCASHMDGLAVLADGVDAVRRAVREELRRGASHIKIMASGGVVSPTDPLDCCQYSDDEVRAAVDEATRMDKYVAAHCHPTAAIRRCVELGVNSIEHGTMIDAPTAALAAERNAFVVPTMAIQHALHAHGRRMGMPEANLAKMECVVAATMQGLDIMRRAGVSMGFGTDLLGALCDLQSTEFTLRARVLPAIEILRSACAVNARLLRQEGRLGCIRPGACADLLVVDGNPLHDISVLARGDETLRVVMVAGRFHKRALP